MSGKYNFLYKIPKDINDTDYQHRENIVNAAAEIFKKFKKYREILTTAEMQSGKTDVMKRVIYIIQKYTEKIRDIGINIHANNIHLVICASSLNLKNQLQEKLSEIKHRIYHLNDINKFIKNTFEYEALLTGMASQGLIIFDECHCDAETGKIIDKFRKILEKYSQENKTDYYKIGFSASPYEQIVAGYPKVIMQPGENYYGLKEMFNTYYDVPLIFQAKNLVDEAECQELFQEIDVYNKYYIFRLPSGKNDQELVMTNIEKAFKRAKSNIDTYIYDMNHKNNINELIEIKPDNPTIIYLKDKLRMGEYLNTRYVYMVHDDPNNMYTHTTIQSLIGRCCGYNKRDHKTIIYCDLEKAWQHYQWIRHDYDIKYLPTECKYVGKNKTSTKNKCIY